MIQGTKREIKEGGNYQKKIGLVEVRVIAINPTAEEIKEVLGRELKEGSTETDYLGETRDGDTKLNLVVWMQDVKTEEKYRMKFSLIDKVWTGRSGKTQFVDNIGRTTWAFDVETINSKMLAAGRPFRECHIGEGDMYSFLRKWLDIDFTKEKAILQVDWKALMKGNVKMLKDQIGREDKLDSPFVILNTVGTNPNTGVEFQNVWTREFLYPSDLKFFNNTDYDVPAVREKFKAKDVKCSNNADWFVKNLVGGDYPCKDVFILKPVKEYNPDKDFVESEKVIAEDDSSF